MSSDKSNLKSLRPQYIYGFLATALVVLVALFFQFVIKIPACPLCIFQRNIFIFIALFLLITIFHNPFNWIRRIYAFSLMLITTVGMVFSGRHVWIQYFSHDDAECGPGLDVLMERLPMTIVIERVFKETGDCAQMLTTLMGLTIPVWSLIAFALLFLFGLKLMVLNK